MDTNNRQRECAMEWLECGDDAETKGLRAWLHDYITRLEGEVDPDTITLKLPVKIRSQPEVPASGYSLVLEDGDGVIHYWLPDGRYDGYSKKVGDARPHVEPAEGGEA